MTAAWDYRGKKENPARKGRTVYYWRPPGGCDHPADGTGLEIQQRVTRAGYAEAPYRVYDIIGKRFDPVIYRTPGRSRSRRL